MQFIDTHCHLNAAEFGNSQGTLVQAAQNAGVGCIVVPSIACTDFHVVHEICAQLPCCAPAYGIHPMYTGDARPEDLLVLREYLAQPDTVAIGEIGLDFFIEPHDRIRQEQFFVEQLKLAREFDLPLLLHIRRAQDIILKYLRQHKVCGGIAHAFNGSRQQADEFIKLGFKLGFGGALTYPHATHLRELAATLPPEAIVLETDAPDIPPSFLQKREPNKPEYLPRIAEVLAELRGLSLERVACLTTGNPLAVLPRLKPLTTAV